MPDFELRRPGTVDEALDLLAAGGTPYCGGTELLAVMRMGLAEPETLVDLKRVDGIVGVEETGDEVMLNARVTHREAQTSPAVHRHAGVLATATSRLGNARVRATGTLAGNICFAEPRSDVLTALLALDARVDLRSVDGQRSVPVEDFVEGAFTTVREETELLCAIRIPKQPSRSAYVRFQPGEYPTATVAVVDRRSGGCRIVVGAVGERPEVFTYPGLEDVDATAIAEGIDVAEDLNGQADYKRHLTSVFVRRALAQVGREETRG
jgi:carbon-monoxide dehydrogenase medium subunit